MFHSVNIKMKSTIAATMRFDVFTVGVHDITLVSA